MKLGLVKYLANDHSLEENLIINKGDSYKDCAMKLLSQINSICSTAADQIDYSNFDKAVKAIEKATNIYLFGVGASAVAAVDFQQKLVRINKKAIYYSDSNIGILATMTYKPGDLAIGISYSGETSIVRNFVEAAKQKGITCIGITGNNQTTIAQMVDISLETPSIERKIRIGAVSSRYSQQFICDMLFLSLVINHYEEAEELTRSASALVSKIV
jgi:DNA-binding MurR/RpiR family transcriptional regulator